MFCPKCGKPADVEGLCDDCFLEGFTLFEVPQVIEAKICAKCPSYKVGDAWVETRLETYEELVRKAADKAIIPLIKINKKATKPKIEINANFINPNILKGKVTVRAFIGDRKVTRDADIEIRIRKETCDMCSRIAGGYYEGVVQVRAEGRFPTQQEVNKCLKIIEKTFERAQKSGDRLAFITDVFPLPEGADVYVGSITCGRQASRAIIDEFSGTVLESPKLVGVKDGKDLYRITFAVRIPNLAPGDIVLMHGKPVLVEKISRRISGIDLLTGYSTSVADEEEPGKIAHRSDAVKTVLVSDEGDSVQVLDPDTYQAVTIKKPAFLKKSPGEDVWALHIKEGLYLLPGGRGEQE